MKSFFVSLALLSLAATPAFAGGPARLQVERTIVREYPAPRIAVEPVRRPNVIDVSLGVDRRSYDYGDSVCVTLRADQDAYVYLFSEEACGTVRQIFPNCFDNDNYVQGCRTYRLPDGGYEFVVRGSEGRETLRAVASSVPLDCLDQEFRRSTRHDPFPTSRYSFTEITTQVNRSLDVHLSEYNSSISFSSSTTDYGYSSRSISVERSAPCPPCPAYGEACVSFYVNPIPFCATPIRVVERPRYYPTHKPVYYEENTSINVNVNIGNNNYYANRGYDSGHQSYGNNGHDRYERNRPDERNNRLQPVTLKNERGENPRYHERNNGSNRGGGSPYSGHVGATAKNILD